MFRVGAGVAGVAFRARVVQMSPPLGLGGPRWLVGRLPSGVGARLNTRSAPLGAVLIQGLVRCPACGCASVIRGGSMFSFCPQGGVIALKVRLAGHCEGGAPCMVVWWLRGGSAGLHEGVERVSVAVVPAGRCSPVGCALGHVGCGCPAFGLRVGSRRALRWRLP